MSAEQERERFEAWYLSIGPRVASKADLCEAWFARAALSAPASMSAEPIEHKQGCDALGGYGHGVGPCSCGAENRGDDETLPEVFTNPEGLIAALKTENRPAQDDVRDAQRYRWLRDQNNSLETRQYDKGIFNGPSCYHEVEGIVELKHGHELDEAIDAAIASQSAKEPKS